MFIVARRGIRLSRRFWFWTLLLFLLFGYWGVVLTFHVHFAPDPPPRD
jgi:hypothetical protein